MSQYNMSAKRRVRPRMQHVGPKTPVAPRTPAAGAPPPQRAPAAGPAGALVPPPDASYEQSIAGLAQQRDTTLAGLTQQRAAGLLQYGYREDPATGAVAFDPTNTYSQAALLKRNYTQQRTGSVNSMAARGQLYSGALQNAQDTSRFDEGRASDQLQKGLAAFLAANTSGRSQAQANFDLGVGDAMGSRLDRVASNPLYDPVVPAAASPAKGNWTDKPGKDSKGNPGIWRTHPNGRKVFMRKP